MRVIRIYRWRCTDRAIEPLARHDVRCAKGPSLLAISLIYSGICWQGKNADTPFATVHPEGQAREADRCSGVVYEPARQGLGAVFGLKEPNTSVRSDAAGAAVEERPVRYDDARLQAQRHHHPVCGTECVGWQGDW